MKQVEALSGFEHGKRRYRGDRFQVSEQHATHLERAGLIKVLGDGPTPENPSIAGGEMSSASPADPASPQTIASPSRRGGRKAKGGASS